MRRRTFILLVSLSYAILFAPLFLSIVAPELFLLELTPTVKVFFALINLAALGFVYVATAFITVQRLQDMNKSGKFAIMTLLPGGFLLLLWIAVQPPVDDERGSNRYGRNPRYPRAGKRGRGTPRGGQDAQRFIKAGTGETPNQKHVGRTLHRSDGRAGDGVQRLH